MVELSAIQQNDAIVCQLMWTLQDFVGGVKYIYINKVHKNYTDFYQTGILQKLTQAKLVASIKSNATLFGQEHFVLLGEFAIVRTANHHIVPETAVSASAKVWNVQFS